MLDMRIEFDLPPPWSAKRFRSTKLGYLNFLVGPNGSGKSRFAEALKDCLGASCRILGTDRLSGMERVPGLGFLGNNFGSGLQKSWFPSFKSAGLKGFGVDAFLILEEQLDIRIRVEATLSHLFNRRIQLDWDSGFLVPKAALGPSGKVYRLDTEECHGIKELLILLTHLYNPLNTYLIIDEPELNLHPQYQAFFMQEVRKIAGNPDPATGKKCFFLITHSPFILEFRSISDLKCIISFDLAYSVPAHMHDLRDDFAERLSTLIFQLNAHHKQLFFSDDPIFVEGTLDSQFIQALQEVRGVSIAAAGSCIIDAGGSGQVSKYLELCRALGKRAHYLFDLDSLFRGALRKAIRNDETVVDFLLALGVGNDFARYCGTLDRKLYDIIRVIKNSPQVSAGVADFRTFLDTLAPGGNFDNDSLARARVALLVLIHRDRGAVIELTSEDSVREIEGILGQIVNALAQVNIRLLPGGALEHYLPSYQGDAYYLTEARKRTAVEFELSILSSGLSEPQMERRYGDLYRAIIRMPSKAPADFDKTLKEYAAEYIHDLQKAIVSQPEADAAALQETVVSRNPGMNQLFRLENFQRERENRFSARLVVVAKFGRPNRFIRITDETNAGMLQFSIEGEHSG